MLSSVRLATFVLLAIAGLVPGCFAEFDAMDGAGAGAPGTGGSSGGGTTSPDGGGGTAGSGGTTNGTGGTGTTTTTTTTEAPECGGDGDCTAKDMDPDPCKGMVCSNGKCVPGSVNESQPCGEPPNPCQNQLRCIQGTCSPQHKANGQAPDGTQTSNDCKTNYCQDGAVVPMNNDADKPFFHECKDFDCDDGTLVTTPENEGEICAGGLGTCKSGKCCNSDNSICL